MKILVVEDDKQLSTTIKDILKRCYMIDIAGTGKRALSLFHSNEYDLVILDINLPDTTGIEICKTIRLSDKDIPILALTGRIEVSDKIKAFDNGFDDYLTKPFQFEELQARIKALLRRKINNTVVDGKIVFSDLILDTKSKTVTRQGKNINLRQKEFQLLEYLMQNKDIVINRNQILNHVWKTSTDPLTNTIDVHIQSLRNKIDKPFNRPPLIKTIYGFGYILKDDCL